jgi:hypothetical protein
MASSANPVRICGTACQVTRRAWLTTVAALATLSAFPAPAAGASPAAFSADDRALLAALARALYGEDADALDVPARLSATLEVLSPDQAALLASLPGLFDRIGRVAVPTLRSFVDLTPEEQAAALADWRDSSLAARRTLYAALHGLVLAHCYTAEASWAGVGYPGPWLGRIDLPVHPWRFGEPT